jgi:hypothetical protein
MARERNEWSDPDLITDDFGRARDLVRSTARMCVYTTRTYYEGGSLPPLEHIHTLLERMSDIVNGRSYLAVYMAHPSSIIAMRHLIIHMINDLSQRFDAKGFDTVKQLYHNCSDALPRLTPHNRNEEHVHDDKLPTDD